MEPNSIELRNIFSLFDPNNNGEIDIKQINQLIKAMDSLNGANQMNKRENQGAKEKQSPLTSQNQLKEEQKLGQASGVSQQQMGNQNSNPGNPPQGSIRKRPSGEETQLMVNGEKKEKEKEKEKEEEGILPNSDRYLPSKQEYVQVMELKNFPNNRSTMNFQEFCEIYNECMNNKELHDELLLNCFNCFDVNGEGYINSKKIKSIFELFKDKTSTDEIHNVLKFCGISNEKMTFQDFKEFFRKNL